MLYAGLEQVKNLSGLCRTAAAINRQEFKFNKNTDYCYNFIMKLGIILPAFLFFSSNIFCASHFYEPQSGNFDPSQKTVFFSEAPYFLSRIQSSAHNPAFEELLYSESAYQNKQIYASGLGFRSLRAVSLGSPQAEAALFRHGQIQFDSKKYAESLKNFESFLRLYARSPLRNEALFWKAQNQFYLEKFEEAIRTLDDLLKSSPERELTEYALLSKAVCFFHLKNYSRALREISGLLSSKPSNKSITEAAYFFAGESWFFRGSFSDAEREYRKVLKNSGGLNLYNAALFRLAHALYQQGKNKAARDELEKLLAEVSSDADTTPKVLYATAEIYFQEKNYAKSASLYKKIISQYADSYLFEFARYSLAWCYLNSAEYKLARTEFLKFYSVYPEHELSESAFYLASMAPYIEGDYPKAAFELKKYYLSRKHSVFRDDAIYYLAICRMKEQDFERALGNFRLVVSRFAESNLYQEAEFMICECLKEMQDYDYAKKSYQEFIAKYPSGGLIDDALLGIAECYYGKNDFAQASDYIAKMLEKYPQSLNRAYAAYLDARILAAREDFEKARAIFENVSKQHPKSPYARLSRLHRELTYYRQKKYSLAAEKLAVLLADASMRDYYDEIYYYIGLAKIKNQDYPGAVEAFKALIEADKNSSLRPEAALRIGDVHFKSGDFGAAIAAYKYMAEEFKTSGLVPFGLYGWAQALKNSGLDADAVAVMEALVDKYPKSAVSEDCGRKIALHYIENADYEKAIAFLKKIRSDFPLSREAPLALVKIGDVETLRGNYGTAENIYRQAVKEYQSSDIAALAFFKIASNFYKLGRYQNAVKEALNVVNSYPKAPASADALELLFAVYSEQNDEANSSSTSEKLLRGFPKTAPAARVFLAYGKKFLSAGKPDEAISKLARAVEAVQGDISAEAQKTIGDSYFAKGNFHQATVEYLRTVYLFPESARWSAEAQYMAGVASEKENQMQEALKAYNRVLKHYESSSWSEKAKERLEILKKAR